MRVSKEMYFFALAHAYAAAIIITLPVAMLAVKYIQRDTDIPLNSLTLALIFGLTFGISQVFFVYQGHNFSLIILVFLGFLIGFFVAKQSGFRLPEDFGDPKFGLLIGFFLGTTQAFFSINPDSRWITTYIWMAANIAGWTLAFWLTDEFATWLIEYGVENDGIYEKLVMPSIGLGSFLAALGASFVLAPAFAFANMSVDSDED